MSYWQMALLLEYFWTSQNLLLFGDHQDRDI